jgi:hypothetical protein
MHMESCESSGEKARHTDLGPPKMIHRLVKSETDHPGWRMKICGE